jgi:hypothetical protein
MTINAGLMLFFVVAASVARAAPFLEAGQLLDLWKSYKASGKTSQTAAAPNGAFESYVLGVADLGEGKQFCGAHRVDRTGVLDVVGLYLETHPRTMHEPAALVVVSALGEVFKCKPDPFITLKTPMN